ncbi:hypothetical protein AM1_4784 [Acaryochloris marina MBIC11017]|uniref:Uncharacterized protein n=1 Tax=Acaryochloris marina (strain MBIC 11017) TaxID=329726 RepID=B0C2G4_ACAM1|nr:hypothetical protein AM1_4784 [Acaryochloris marina MBIC11017]
MFWESQHPLYLPKTHQPLQQAFHLLLQHQNFLNHRFPNPQPTA